MPRKGTMQINITFRRDEADLYDWIMTVAGKDGVSSYIKRLIKADMNQVLGLSAIATRVVMEKIFSEWAWCERCGAHAELRKVKEEPDRIEFIYWCSSCGMGYKKILNKSEVSNFDEIRRIVAKARETISKDAEKKHEALRELTRKLKGKELADAIL